MKRVFDLDAGPAEFIDRVAPDRGLRVVEGSAKSVDLQPGGTKGRIGHVERSTYPIIGRRNRDRTCDQSRVKALLYH
jgi:hypothetical protein